ncbi:adenylyl-sulfate kinase [Phytoactinopolyspora mesophila]|uniref:Adenylyl-sulfate kinase n=1 Tax=Phytoactinopolyspora mesophila TaxID=2650750 RepID=A0A7K3M5N1_9ACTN|nr:adenylyl-sulfate kinase [Phytoactinopolyspora mesophila]
MTHSPSPQPPRFTPDAVTLAEVELARLGIGPAEISINVPADIGSKARAAGRLVVTDREGAPAGTLDIHGSTAEATGDDHGTVAVRGTVGTGDADEPRGPHSSLRAHPGKTRFDGWSAIVSHDPPDTYTLRAAGTDRPLLFIVLDGPRERPGPETAVTIRAVLTLREELRDTGQVADVVLVPAPHYGDHRDDALAVAIAESFGADLVRPALRADHAALQEGLDGGGQLPAAEWPAPSLEAWRRWRPPRHERGLVVFFTGLSGSGKSTVARAVVDRLNETTDRTVTLLDGDLVRRNLSAGLGFSRADRDRNVERIGFVAAEIARHGGLVVCAPIAPFAATRARVRQMVSATGDFVLIHVATPVEECERRDRKGLYARARAGELPDFTGISSPYETPRDADLVLDTTHVSVDEARDAVLGLLTEGGWLPPHPT